MNYGKNIMINHTMGQNRTRVDIVEGVCGSLGIKILFKMRSRISRIRVRLEQKPCARRVWVKARAKCWH